MRGRFKTIPSFLYDTPAGHPIPVSAAEGCLSLQVANISCGKYLYTQDLLQLDSCTDTSRCCQWPVAQSPVHLTNWIPSLVAHPDRVFAAYIHAGLSHGFRIGFNHQGPRLKASQRNHPSAATNKSVVSNFIRAERSAGRLLGPISFFAAQNVHASPIGLVPKSHQVDKFRMIVDLSSPRGHSVNDSISSELASITYTSLDDAVQHILQLGRGTDLVKLDLKNAYRMVPVHPQDQHLLAISWEGMTYVDCALPFGLCSAPKIFSAVADAIAWALHLAGINRQIHYLDDFLFMATPNTHEGQ